MVCFSTAHQKTKSTSCSKTKQNPPSLDHVNAHDNLCDLTPSIRPYLHNNLMHEGASHLCSCPDSCGFSVSQEDQVARKMRQISILTFGTNKPAGPLICGTKIHVYQLMCRGRGYLNSHAMSTAQPSMVM